MEWNEINQKKLWKNGRQKDAYTKNLPIENCFYKRKIKLYYLFGMSLNSA